MLIDPNYETTSTITMKNLSPLSVAFEDSLNK